MSLKEAQHKLSADITNLYETYQLISKNKQQFNDLDIALLQQQLLYIYHSLLKVQSQLGQVPQPEDLVLPVETKPAAIEEAKPGDLFTANPEPKEEPAPVEKKEEAEPVKEPVTATIQPEPVIIPEKPKQPEPVVPEPTLDDLEKLMKEQEAREEEEKASKPEERSLFTPEPVSQPQATENTLSLLDKLTANMRTPDVHEKIAREQISLKQAINLNKKIAFVNNLFNENTVEYAKAIERLNSASGSHEALRYFSELKHQYNWNNENPLVKDLEQLVERRYA